MTKKNIKKCLFIIIIFIIIFLISFFSFQFATNNTKRTKDTTLLSFKFTELNNNNLKKLDLNNIYDYNIYYYGISEVIISYDNQTFNLEEALKEKVISMEQIIERSEKSAKENKISSSQYLDGGSTLYKYENLTILKCNTDGTNNKDVYIGNTDMDLNDINDLNATLSEDTSWLDNWPNN